MATASPRRTGVVTAPGGAVAMATADVLESLSFAYGARGVAKLIDRLRLEGDEPQPEEDIVANCDSLTRLNGLLSNQESKLVALGHDSLVPTLKGMLGHSAADPRRLAALSLASLALVFQGRLAIRDEEVVAVLSELARAPPSEPRRARGAARSRREARAGGQREALGRGRC